jgi:hypothetical protein
MNYQSKPGEIENTPYRQHIRQSGLAAITAANAMILGSMMGTTENQNQYTPSDIAPGMYLKMALPNGIGESENVFVSTDIAAAYRSDSSRLPVEIGNKGYFVKKQEGKTVLPEEMTGKMVFSSMKDLEQMLKDVKK